MRATVIGLGLIGGSIAIDLRKAGVATHLIGVDLNADHTTQALELGLVDEIKSLEEAALDTDLIITAIPVNAIRTVLLKLLDLIGKDTIIIDTGSTKASICKAVAEHSKRSQFIAAHPLAGTENSGPNAAF